MSRRRTDSYLTIRAPLTGALFACLLLISACAVNPVTGKQDLVLMSEAQELALGRQAHQQTLQEYRIYPDPALQQYVDAVGQKLAEKSHRTDLSYTFTVLDSSEINAFALPGGFIYITRGLLAYMNSEAELAAVLGHEIGHVTARHGVRQASSAQAASLGAGLASIFFPQLRGAGMQQSLGMLSTAVIRGYGREHELEADRLGANYIGAAGYDPQAMMAVIRALKNHELLDQKLAALEGREARRYHGVFSTHPDNDTRLREIVQHARDNQTGGELQSARFFDQIDGLLVGENPADGVVANHSFLHPELDIALSIPPQWAVQNQPDKLLIAPKKRDALVSVELASLPPGNQSDAAINDYLRRRGINGLQSARQLVSGRLVGTTAIAQVQTTAGSKLSRIAIILDGERVYLTLAAARDDQRFVDLDKVFLSIVDSFRPLSAADRAQIRSQRIKITRPRASISWQTLAQSSPLTPLPEARLRALNGGTQDVAVSPGATIKLVVEQGL